MDRFDFVELEHWNCDAEIKIISVEKIDCGYNNQRMEIKCWLSLEQQQKLCVFANIGFVKLAIRLGTLEKFWAVAQI